MINALSFIDDYDLRQLAHMEYQIKYYIEGDLGLGGLIGDLTFLRDTLQVMPSEWNCMFNEKILDLESIYSYVIEHDKNKINENNNKKIIDDAINVIKSLIATHPKFRKDYAVDTNILPP